MSKEIEKVKQSGLSRTEEVPEWLKPQIGHAAGLENVEQSDLLLPRLGLCQSLSPQRRKSDPAFIEGLNEGDLFNTVTKEIYGPVLENVIPLFFFKNRIKFFDIDEGGGIDCTSPNGINGGRISPDGCSICKYSGWGNGQKDDEHGNDAPECTLYHNLMLFTLSDMSPMALSYKSTGLKMSKQFLASVRLTRLPMYAKVYKINVVEKHDANNVWFEKTISPTGFAEKEMFEEMEKQFKALKDINIVVDTTGEEKGDTSFNAATTEL